MPLLHMFKPDATDSVACHHSLCILNTLQEEEEEDDDEEEDEEEEEGDWLDCKWCVKAPERPSEVGLPEQKEQLFLPNKVPLLLSVQPADCENSMFQVPSPVIAALHVSVDKTQLVNDTLAASLTPVVSVWDAFSLSKAPSVVLQHYMCQACGHLPAQIHQSLYNTVTQVFHKQEPHSALMTLCKSHKAANAASQKSMDTA